MFWSFCNFLRNYWSRLWSFEILLSLTFLYKGETPSRMTKRSTEKRIYQTTWLNLSLLWTPIVTFYFIIIIFAYESYTAVLRAYSWLCSGITLFFNLFYFLKNYLKTIYLFLHEGLYSVILRGYYSLESLLFLVVCLIVLVCFDFGFWATLGDA